MVRNCSREAEVAGFCLLLLSFSENLLCLHFYDFLLLVVTVCVFLVGFCFVLFFRFWYRNTP